MLIFNNSLFEALKTVYPEYKWLPWKFAQVPRGYWQSKENIKNYLDWLAEEEINDLKQRSMPTPETDSEKIEIIRDVTRYASKKAGILNHFKNYFSILEVVQKKLFLLI